MDRQRIARELVAVARELTGRAPQMRAPKMKHRWKDMDIGQKFRFKNKKWIKVTRYQAVQVKDFQTFRDDLEMYELAG